MNSYVEKPKPSDQPAGSLLDFLAGPAGRAKQERVSETGFLLVSVGGNNCLSSFYKLELALSKSALVLPSSSSTIP
jgi:hypothetical protein